MQNLTTRPITWFEIPATDYQRAVSFYETIFAIHMPQHDPCGSGVPMAFFPYTEPATGGAVVANELQPGADGTVVYLNAGRDLDAVLSRVTAAGGRVVMDKTLITDEIGHVALIVDSEGNRVGLHRPAA